MLGINTFKNTTYYHSTAMNDNYATLFLQTFTIPNAKLPRPQNRIGVNKIRFGHQQWLDDKSLCANSTAAQRVPTAFVRNLWHFHADYAILVLGNKTCIIFST